jgi:hypothetical protein
MSGLTKAQKAAKALALQQIGTVDQHQATNYPVSPEEAFNPEEASYGSVNGGTPVFVDEAPSVEGQKEDPEVSDVTEEKGPTEAGNEQIEVATIEEVEVVLSTVLVWLDEYRTNYSQGPDNSHVHDLNLSMNHLGFSITSLSKFIEDTK